MVIQTEWCDNACLSVSVSVYIYIYLFIYRESFNIQQLIECHLYTCILNMCVSQCVHSCMCYCVFCQCNKWGTAGHCSMVSCSPVDHQPESRICRRLRLLSVGVHNAVVVLVLFATNKCGRELAAKNLARVTNKIFGENQKAKSVSSLFRTSLG